MQPIMHAYVPGSASIQDASTVDRSGEDGKRYGNEGQILLAALQDFISATMRLKIANSEKKPEDIGAIPDEQDKPGEKTIEIIADIPRQIPCPEIQNKIIDALRPRIFNEMPIRVLAFASAGESLEIIDRGEMFRRVLAKVYTSTSTPAFDADWTHAQQMTLSDEPEISDAGYREQKHLLVELVRLHSRYAILSHTWIRDTPGDIVFQDWATRAANPRGNRKIDMFCAVAARDYGVAFGWMDTVCIDKTSSSELDEAIRSMYKWYRGAHVCIAYMAETRALARMHRDSWFSRGWTLQELLAPTHIRFYDMDWDDFFTEGATALRDLPFFPAAPLTVADIHREIRTATSISEYEVSLFRRGDTERIALSRRFQLASKRQVTREEDGAYSLMGLLGVDLSVAYGEGAARAFFRLVRELLATKTHVLDLFNHAYWGAPQNRLLPVRILQYFYRTHHFDPYTRDGRAASLLDRWQPLEPIVLTHLGVRIPLLLAPALKLPADAERCEFVPKGEFYASISLDIWSDTEGTVVSCDNYNVLDARIYEDRHLEAQSDYMRSTITRQNITFGIMNFGMDGDNVLLPQEQQCFSVMLDCGLIPPGHIYPSDNSNIHIVPTHGAPIFQFGSSRGTYRIPRGELERHGLQLVTLFL
ncbi:hypothetical protein HYPSUDRAFT_293607 [Hypholoma sublateritium FD-334 SS-4]|nr:hypothetical protein HYPSUDRAFT_293607 [Hypholoma sublateritium FD-334 SS-4]